jgi:hypothetical protein
MQSGVRIRGDNQKNQLRVCERASDHRGFVVQISPVHVKMEHESLEQRDAIQIKDATPSLLINQFAARYSGPDTKDLLITVPPTKLGFPRSQTMIKDGGLSHSHPAPTSCGRTRILHFRLFWVRCVWRGFSFLSRHKLV